MLRLSLKRYTLGLAVVAALVIPSMFVSGAQGAQRSSNKYYPPLMRDWQIVPLKVEQTPTGEIGKFAVGLTYTGFLNAFYPQIGKKDIIPAMWTKLLPNGVTLLDGAAYKSQFSDSGYRFYYHKPIPKTNLRWQKGFPPTWKVLRVAAGFFPRAVFWVRGQPGQCFSVTTQGMYRHHKQWVRIPHAPVQPAQACLPKEPPTTTTTG